MEKFDVCIICDNVNAFVMAIDFCNYIATKEHITNEIAQKAIHDYEEKRNSTNKHVGLKMHLTPKQFVYFSQIVPTVGRKMIAKNNLLILE